MTKKGGIRFEVNFAPSDKFDTVDDANYGMLSERFADFSAAVTFAVLKAPNDFFGVVSVERLVCTSAKYDHWDNDATWHIEAGTSASDYDIEAPDYTEAV